MQLLQAAVELGVHAVHAFTHALADLRAQVGQQLAVLAEESHLLAQGIVVLLQVLRHAGEALLQRREAVEQRADGLGGLVAVGHGGVQGLLVAQEFIERLGAFIHPIEHLDGGIGQLGVAYFFELLQKALLHAHVLGDAGNERRELVNLAEEVVLNLAEKLGIEGIEHCFQVAHAGLHVGVQLGQQGFLQKGVVGVFVAVAGGAGLLQQLVAGQRKGQAKQAANHGNEHAAEEVLHVAVAEGGILGRVGMTSAKGLPTSATKPRIAPVNVPSKPRYSGVAIWA